MNSARIEMGGLIGQNLLGKMYQNAKMHTLIKIHWSASVSSLNRRLPNKLIHCHYLLELTVIFDLSSGKIFVRLQCQFTLTVLHHHHLKSLLNIVSKHFFQQIGYNKDAEKWIVCNV